jgi:thiamine monophosphate synthase
VNFILMLTRNDRTIADAEAVAEAALELGIRHIGFKDIGASSATMRALVQRIRDGGGTSYLEVVSTTSDAVARSLETGRAVGVDRILGGTDLAAAARVLGGNLACYFPFPGRPVDHPTRLAGSPELVAEHTRCACELGCGGVDLLAYRATDADPIELVRAARHALAGGLLIVAGSVNSPMRIHALAAAGVDAFTIGSAIFDGSFSPAKCDFRGQVLDVFEACARAPRMSA